MHTKKLSLLVGAGVALLLGGGAAVAASVPDAADDGLTKASSNVGVELPASRESHPPADEPAPVEGSSAETDDAETPAQGEEPTLPEAAEFGQTVAEAARSGASQEDGPFGHWVRDQAQARHDQP